MSTTPRPNQVQSDLSQIVNVLSPAVLKAYRWAYSVRFEAVRRSEGGGKGSDRTDPVTQAVCVCAPNQRGTCGRCRTRSKIDHAARSVRVARRQLVGALNDLEEAMRAADGGEATLMSEHDTRIPRVASHDEVAAARAAAAKRAKRHEGFGAA